MMKYELIETPIGEALQGTDEDGLIHHIPKDEANSDYQAYLSYLAEQGGE